MGAGVRIAAGDGDAGLPAALMLRKIRRRVLLAAAMCCKLRGRFSRQLLLSPPHCLQLGAAVQPPAWASVDTSRAWLLLGLLLGVQGASACARRSCLLCSKQFSNA